MVPPVSWHCHVGTCVSSPDPLCSPGLRAGLAGQEPLQAPREPHPDCRPELRAASPASCGLGASQTPPSSSPSSSPHLGPEKGRESRPPPGRRQGLTVRRTQSYKVLVRGRGGQGGQGVTASPLHTLGLRRLPTQRGSLLAAGTHAWQLPMPPTSAALGRPCRAADCRVVPGTVGARPLFTGYLLTVSSVHSVTLHQPRAARCPLSLPEPPLSGPPPPGPRPADFGVSKPENALRLENSDWSLQEGVWLGGAPGGRHPLLQPILPEGPVPGGRLS